MGSRIRMLVATMAFIITAVLVAGGIASAQNVNNSPVCGWRTMDDGRMAYICVNPDGTEVLVMTTDAPDGKDGAVNQTVTIDCPGTGPKTFTWGSAGMAPQTLEGVRDALGLDNTDFVTRQLICEGNDTTIGWIIGTTDSEADGIIQHIGNLPAGTCVDYDEGPSQIQGDIVASVDYTPLWRRSLIGPGIASADGLKFTVYWTPCDMDDDNSVAEGVTTSSTITGTTDINITPAVETEEEVFEPEPDPNACPTTNRGYAKAVVVNGNAAISVRKVANGGRQLTSNKSFTVRRPNDNWVLHTPQHPADPGLRSGKETLTVVTAYCNL